jgi:hypothetical protein
MGIGLELPRSQWHRAVPDGVFEFIDADGRSSLEARVRSELTRWETAVWAPIGLLEAPVRTLWRTLGAMALSHSTRSSTIAPHSAAML